MAATATGNEDRLQKTEDETDQQNRTDGDGPENDDAQLR